MIRVAFCSEDEQYIDAHFARSSNIIIYEFVPSSFYKVDIHSFKSKGIKDNDPKEILEHQNYEREDEEKRLLERIEAVKGCSILYCSQIGGPAVARLMQHNVFPLKTQGEMRIDDAAQRLHQMFIHNTPHWLQDKF